MRRWKWLIAAAAGAGLSFAARGALAMLLLRLAGWRIEGQKPDVPKYVAIVAPHTSNWDFLVMLAIAQGMGIKAKWMGKHTLFRWPFGLFFQLAGGVAIDRTASHNTVDQAVDEFRAAERLVLAILPEGTRKKLPYWKSGFYHIAHGAGVPIVLGFADYRRRVGGLGPTIIPSGDIEADMARIRDFYTGVAGKRPEQMSDIQVRKSAE